MIKIKVKAATHTRKQFIVKSNYYMVLNYYNNFIHRIPLNNHTKYILRYPIEALFGGKLLCR